MGSHTHTAKLKIGSRMTNTEVTLRAILGKERIWTRSDKRLGG